MWTDQSGEQRDSASSERKFWIGVNAAGFSAQFELPEKHFNELFKWLAERADKAHSTPSTPDHVTTPNQDE